MKAKYNNLNNCFTIKKEFTIDDIIFIIVKQYKDYAVFEKQSGLILKDQIKKDQYNDHDLIKVLESLYNNVIFFQWKNYILNLIEKQKIKSWLLIYINNTNL